MNKRPVDFREKVICNIPDSDITEVAVTHGENSYTVVKAGADWKATKPAKFELDPAKFTPIAGAFKEMKATGIAEQATAKTNGLAKPQATIAIKAEGGRQLPAQGRRRDQGQGELPPRQRDQARRLPGAQVEHRSRPGEDDDPKK